MNKMLGLNDTVSRLDIVGLLCSKVVIRTTETDGFQIGIKEILGFDNSIGEAEVAGSLLGSTLVVGGREIVGLALLGSDKLLSFW